MVISEGSRISVPMQRGGARRSHGRTPTRRFRSLTSGLEGPRLNDQITTAPSHGPAYDDPSFIIDAYRDWVSPNMKNEVVLPYVSMHGSTYEMVMHLIDSLAAKDVAVYAFDLAVTDIGKLAIALVDAATLIVGTPTVHVGPHPAVYQAAHLANLLRPKVRHAAIVGSYGWSSKAIEQISALIPNLNVDVLGAFLHKGRPDEKTFAELDGLATSVARAHAEDELVTV